MGNSGLEIRRINTQVLISGHFEYPTSLTSYRHPLTPSLESYVPKFTKGHKSIGLISQKQDGMRGRG